MNSTYENATVQIIGGIYPDNETLRDAHVAILGVSPNCTVKLSQRDNVARRYRTFDVLTECAAVETETDDGVLVRFNGVSRQMIQDIGLDETDAKVQWDVYPVGCKSC